MWDPRQGFQDSFAATTYSHIRLKAPPFRKSIPCCSFKRFDGGGNDNATSKLADSRWSVAVKGKCPRINVPKTNVQKPIVGSVCRYMWFLRIGFPWLAHWSPLREVEWFPDRGLIGLSMSGLRFADRDLGVSWVRSSPTVGRDTHCPGSGAWAD